MSFQNLLASEYSRSVKEVLRFAIIVGNILSFYFLCGMRSPERFGPMIDENRPFAPWTRFAIQPVASVQNEVDPLEHTSILDIIAMILAILVAMRQLTFGRPEIDSYNQTIYLLPQEKNSALVLFLFTIFKLLHQFWYSRVEIFPYESTLELWQLNLIFSNIGER
jgi:hypothetical protein